LSGFRPADSLFYFMLNCNDNRPVSCYYITLLW
jgi:hypothetical protein